MTMADFAPFIEAGGAMLLEAIPLGMRVLGRWCNKRGLPESNLDDSRKPIPHGVPESVANFSEALENVRNQRVTGVLGETLAFLVDEPDWEQVNRRLHEAVRQWSHDRPEGAGNPPDHDQMHAILLQLIRELREAGYRSLCAEYYLRPNSVDRRDSLPVDDVFIGLKIERPYDNLDGPDHDQLDEQFHRPEHLDFRGKEPADIETMLRDSGNLVILGEPGAGKSTLLRYLAASCAQSNTRNPYLPIFLRLSDYAGGKEVLIAESAVAFAEGTLQLKMPDSFFEDALRNGNALVCLDALDEVPAAERHAVMERIQVLIRASHPYSKSRFVVTSRVAGYDEEPLDEQRFTRCIAQPMDDDDIYDFIERRFPQRAQSLRDVLAANPSIESLASNPLLTTMLNMVYRDDDQRGLPLKTAELYARAIEYLINDKDFKVDGDTRDKPFYANRKEILVAVAHHLHSEGRESIGKTPLERFVARFLESNDRIENVERSGARRQAQDFVKLAEQRTGLLVGENAGRATEFRFLHSTFREYLAAHHIYLKHYTDEPDALWEEIKDHLTDYRWREVILFLLGGLGEDEEYGTYLTERILAAGCEELDHDHLVFDPLPVHLQLAVDALINQAPMSSELQRTILGLLGRIAKDTGLSLRYRHQRVRELGALMRISEMAAVPLVAIASDRWLETALRLHAAEYLAQLIDETQAISLFISILTDSTLPAWDGFPLDPLEGSYVYLHVVDTDDPAWDEHDENQIAAMKQSSAREVAALIGAYSDPTVDVDSRVRAGLRLVGWHDSVIGRSVLEGFCQDPQVDVRNKLRAVGVLETHGEWIYGEGYPLKERKKTAISTLTNIATDSEAASWDRMDAAEALALLGEWETAIPLLIDIHNAPDIDFDVDWELANCGEWVEKISLSNDVNYLSGGAWPCVSAALDAWRQGLDALLAFDASPRVSDALAALDFVEGEQVRSWLNEIANGSSSDVWERVVARGALRMFEETDKAMPLLTSIANCEEVDDISRLRADRHLDGLHSGEWLDGPAINVMTEVAENKTTEPAIRFEACRVLVTLGESATARAALDSIANDPAVRNHIRKLAKEELDKLNEK